MPSFWGSDGQLVDGRYELTGRNAVQNVVANNVQLRDTTSHYFPGNTNTYSTTTLLDVLICADKGFHVYNSHDQAVQVQIFGDMNKNPGNSNTQFIILPSESLAAGAKKWYGSSAFAILKDAFPYLVLQITPSVAPTTGAVLATFQGGPR